MAYPYIIRQLQLLDPKCILLFDGYIKITKRTQSIMNPSYYIVLLILVSACSGSIFYLISKLKKDGQLISLIGLFCMAMGIFLLVLDLVLISLAHGPQYIPDYLLFNRLISDTGFIGRWVLTVYVLSAQALPSAFICLPLA